MGWRLRIGDQGEGFSPIAHKTEMHVVSDAVLWRLEVVSHASLPDEVPTILE